MNKRTAAFALIAILAISSATVLILYYQFGYQPQKQSNTSPQSSDGTAAVAGAGPSIFATLSFSNETGFVTTVHPTSGTIEFVLLPNDMGEFTVTYTGIADNNITWVPFTNPDVYSVNLQQNGTLETGSGLSVTQSNLTIMSPNQVVVNYSVTSKGSDGLYVLDLPSTFLSTIIEVGTQPYTGPLRWLNGIIN